MSKWKVYISSTFIDLKEYRQTFINLFEKQLGGKFEVHPRIMEWMHDTGNFQFFTEDCIKAVEESDIYILIFGNRIGSYPPGEERTYTEIEFDTAVKNNKKIYFFPLAKFDTNKIDNREKHTALLAKYNQEDFSESFKEALEKNSIKSKEKAQELVQKFKGKFKHPFKNKTELENALLKCLFPFSFLDPINAKNPYKGLAAFNIEDGAYFFGRDKEVEEVLKTITTTEGNSFLSVIGNSGIGKSSFVKAGVLHHLKRRDEYGYAKFKQIVVVPGSTPFTNLKFQLRKLGTSVEKIKSEGGVVLFFDQFEEIITQCHNENSIKERSLLIEFLNDLFDLQPTEDIVVLTSFRSDYLSILVNFRFIKSTNQFPLTSLDYKVHAFNWEESIEEIISKPAQKNGVIIEKELVNQLINEIKDVDGSLSILQLSLRALWSEETIKDRVITVTEYSKLSNGKGISGIVEVHAEKVVNYITNSGKNKAKENIIRTILVNLIEVNENQNDVRRTASKEGLLDSLREIYPFEDINEVFETLVSEEARLLVLTEDNEKSTSVDIIHEELIRKWGRLKTWIDLRRNALNQRDKILMDVNAYENGTSKLYGWAQIKKLKRWSNDYPDLLNTTIKNFTKQSEKRGLLRLRNYAILSFMMLFLSLGYLFLIKPHLELKEFIRTIETSPELLELKANIKRTGGLDSTKSILIESGNEDLLIPNIKFFKNLDTIGLNDVSVRNLSFLKDLKKPESIKAIYVASNENLKDIDDLKKLINLRSLLIGYNYKLERIDSSIFEGMKKMENLKIEDNPLIREIGFPRSFNTVSYLDLSSNDSLEEIYGLKNLKNLKALDLFLNKSLNNFEDLKWLDKLKSLRISNINSIESSIPSEILKNLDTLGFRPKDPNLNIIIPTTLEKLKRLSVYDTSYGNISRVDRLVDLTDLMIFDCKDSQLLLSDDFPNLNTLTIANNRNLEKIVLSENMFQVKSINVFGNDFVTEISGIKDLINLEEITMFRNNLLKGIEISKNQRKLFNIKVYDNERLHEITGLEQMRSLKNLRLGEVVNFNEERIRKNNPKIEIRVGDNDFETVLTNVKISQ